ncbi:MAG: GDSL-type esterase/lipase family protein [Opitutales bacterium]|nr:GDSL-type esterase/lipase family protein [Opitutales bacterium]
MSALSASGQSPDALTINGGTLIFFGDSITQQGTRPAGYISLVSDAIAESYSERNIQVIGAGVGGNKVPDLLKRLDRDVLSKQPDVVMIYIGINDVWHWTRPHPVTKEKREGTTAEAYEKGLRNMIDQIQAVGADVILCTPTVIGEQLGGVNPDDARLNQYAAICRSVAIDTGATLLDLRHVFVDFLSAQNADNLKRGVLTSDGVHMNDAGNRLIAQQVCELLSISFPQDQNVANKVFAQNKENLHLYLLIGQSNMAGRAKIPDDAKGDIESCFLLNDQGEWTPAANPLNQYSSVRKDIGMQKLGPGYSFAKTMLHQNPEISLGLVVNALGGSKVESWKKGGRLYTQAVTRMKVAQQSGALKGILWHQGESNHTDDEYLPKLIQLIADLRADLGDASLPVVVGQINNVSLINEQLAALPVQVPHTACVSSEGLTAQDRWHFDTKSQLKLGERYAEAMMTLITKEN